MLLPRHAYSIVTTSVYLISVGTVYFSILKLTDTINFTNLNEHHQELLYQIPVETYTKKKSVNEFRNSRMKYILLWHVGNPLHILRTGQESFVKNKCKHFNCYITNNKSYIRNLQDFDAILFSGCAIRLTVNSNIPRKRSVKQKYIFASLEPAPMYTIVDPVFDNFFNWTWTYRLDSDIPWKYFLIFDKNSTVVGPAKDMEWPNEMEPINEHLKIKLDKKTKAAAWLVSHCKTSSHREAFVQKTQEELRKYGWSVDLYGDCSKNLCKRKSRSCLEMLSRDYYFYFAFENSFDEDYVSEKILYALENLMVPVVYGGANYTRFLPPGSYLDARDLGPEKLAELINSIIMNKASYYDFFRWINHFEYKRSDRTDELCNLCTALNSKRMVRKKSSYQKFREWWNGRMRQQVLEFLLTYIVNNKALLQYIAKYSYTPESRLDMFETIGKHIRANIEGVRLDLTTSDYEIGVKEYTTDVTVYA